MRIKVSLFATFLLLAALPGRAQDVDPSCLVLWQYSPLCPCSYDPYFIWFNDDSVMVYMCQDSEYLEEFARNKFVAVFRYYIFPIPDSVARIDNDTATHTWRDLDLAYSDLRNSLDSLERRFGPFTMRHQDDGSFDTSKDVRAWWIDFARYVRIDSVVSELYNLPDLNSLLHPDFEGYPTGYESVGGSDPRLVQIWPTPCQSLLYIQGVDPRPQLRAYDALGRRIAAPISSVNGETTIDFSAQPNGLIYLYCEGNVFKVLIQH